MTDSSPECPVCDEARGDPTRLYRHLQVTHRKSTVARVLVDTACEGGSPPEEDVLANE